jgi:putative Mg2+ transporter-C (MgtC) family protein
MFMIIADLGGTPVSDVPELIAPLRYEANFRRQDLSHDPGKAEYSFEVSRRRPERSGPPLDLLRVVSERYPIAVFELTSENGC